METMSQARRYVEQVAAEEAAAGAPLPVGTRSHMLAAFYAGVQAGLSRAQAIMGSVVRKRDLEPARGLGFDPTGESDDGAEAARQSRSEP